MEDDEMKITKLSEHQEYRAACDRVASLKTALRGVEIEIADVLSEPFETISTDARAAKMARGEAVSEAKKLNPRNEKYPELCDRRNVLTKAIEIAIKAAEEVRAKISRQVGEQLRPHYRCLVKDIRDRALALAEATAEVDKFQAEIADAGYLSTLPSAAWTAIGQPDDPSSRLSVYVRELEAVGLL
jgi:hypothetical protein